MIFDNNSRFLLVVTEYKLIYPLVIGYLRTITFFFKGKYNKMCAE